MAGFYLAIATTGLTTLVAMGLVFAVVGLRIGL
jgi:hypothetical protein